MFVARYSGNFTFQRQGLKARGSSYLPGFKWTVDGLTITIIPLGMVYPAYVTSEITKHALQSYCKTKVIDIYNETSHQPLPNRYTHALILFRANSSYTVNLSEVLTCLAQHFFIHLRIKYRADTDLFFLNEKVKKKTSIRQLTIHLNISPINDVRWIE